MNRAFLLALAMLFAANAALAQAGAICLFADPQGTDCNIRDDGPGVLSIYVVHTLTAGATASQFWAPMPTCMAGASWLSDANVVPVVIGDSQTGVSAGYGACLSEPIHILTINYMTAGQTEADCAYRVLPHPATLDVGVTDCNYDLFAAGGGKTYLNSTLGCVCEEIMPADLVVSPGTLQFGGDLDELTFDITNAGGVALQWNLQRDQTWMGAAPTFGTGDATITVSVDRGQLGAGTFEGHVLVYSNGGDDTVTVFVSHEPVLSVSPASLDFGTMIDQSVLLIANTGTGVLTWNVNTTAPWIWMVPLSGSGNGMVLVRVDRTGLEPGSYVEDIVVISNAGNVIVPVSMTIEPILMISLTTLDFGALAVEKTFAISNVGNGTLTWDAATAAPWMSIGPMSGNGNATVTVTVDRTGLANGLYEDAITVTSNGGDGVVLVSLNVGPELRVSPASIHFGGITTVKTFLIENPGSGSLTWDVTPDSPWIDALPMSGTDDATVTVTVDRCWIPPGTTEHGSVQVTSNAGDETVSITADWVPELLVSATYLPFEGNDPGPKTFQVQTVCLDTAGWSAEIETAIDFFAVNPMSGNGSQTITVSIAPPSPMPTEPVWGFAHVRSASGHLAGTVMVWWVPDDVLVPTQKNTWGSVKSKYKEEQER